MHRLTAFAQRLCLVLLLLGCLSPLLNVQAQNTSTKKIPLNEALGTIEKKFGYRFAYEHDLLNGKYTNSAALEGKTVEEVLKNVLYPNNLLFLYVSENSYSIVARDSRFFKGNTSTPVQTQAENIPAAPAGQKGVTVRGQVVDENGNGLPFVNIWLKKTNTGAQSTDRGEFAVPNVAPGDTLVFSYVGFDSRQVAMYGQNNLLVQMISNRKNVLEEVTVVSTGLQQLPKERATGSFATIGAKEIEKVPVPNLIQRLEGQLSGVRINVMAGDRSFLYGGAGNQQSLNGGTRTMGANDYNMTIRGQSTLLGERFPLVVVDGAITDLDISTLNPSDVDNITFLKDAAAASIWGIRAANGVMVVTTKKGRSALAPSISFSVNSSIAERPDLGYLRLMNSKQQIGYETELVNRGYLNANNLNISSYSYAQYSPTTAAGLLLKLKAGTITQAAYNYSIDSLGSIDNSSQISHYLLQPAVSQQYNLSVSGGSANTTYFYSASYSREKSNTKGNDGQRLTLTLNNSWKLFKVATLSTSIKGSFFRYVNDGIPMTQLFPRTGKNTLMPYMQLVDNNGNSVYYDRINPDFTKTLSPAFKDWRYNYLNELANNDDVQKDNNYVANVNLKVPIFKGLSGMAMYTNERTFSNRRVFYNDQTFYFRDFINNFTYPAATATINSLGITTGGIFSQVNTTVNNYSFRGQLAYDNTLGQIHQLNAVAGAEMRQTQMGQGTSTLYGYNMATGIAPSMNYSSSGYLTINGYNNSLGGGPAQGDKRRRYLSYFSNASYTLLDRYTLSGSVRYDDYNNFGLAVKYRATPLWSAGAKWNVDRESFMKSVKWVDRLGLRITYGVNGNISTALYPFTYISLGSNDPVTGFPTSNVIALANPDLRWEKTYVTNLGADFSLFNSRVNGSVDVYKKTSKDLLYQFAVDAAYTGTINGGNLTRNISRMEGKGIDFNVNVLLYSNKNISWTAGGTFAYNVNKITDSRFDTATISASTKSYTPGIMGNLVGYSTDKLLVFRYAGLNPSGNAVIYRGNGDTASATTNVYIADLKNAGHTIPPYFGSWNTSFRYKQFTVYALLTYQFGSVFMRPGIYQYITQYYTMNYSLGNDVAKRWQNPGDEKTTNIPGLNGTATQVNYSLNRYMYSDANVLKADYIRLREISLSYQLPSALLGKSPVKGASVTGTVRNLGLIWRANKEGFDPDFTALPGLSYSLPAARSYNLALNINF
ncbi:MAG: SusC/RagA family TonB-linked outer membrane protein [Bacteroidetes bacterium]|nr:SusC/RagA family TonB-linked outer membrane protein [Bacteroidota bacterium]